MFAQDFPDLGFIDSCIQHSGPISPPQEEGLFLNSSGELFGTINMYDQCDANYTLSSNDENLKRFADLTGKSVARIVVHYKLVQPQHVCEEHKEEKAKFCCNICEKYFCDECKEHKHREFSPCLIKIEELLKDFELSKKFFGTAFRVSNRKLVTAMHVMQEKHEVHHRIVPTFVCEYKYYGPAYIIHHHCARVQNVVSSSSPNIFKVNKLAQLTTPPKEDWDAWKESYDYCFLQFEDRQPSIQDMPISFPLVHKPVSPTSIAAVFGYPINMEFEKFLADYCPDSSNENGYKELFYQASKYFDFEILSTSEEDCEQEKDSAIFTHRCPTIRGCSGGLLTFVTESSCVLFHGIHLGGDKKMPNNKAVNVKTKSLAKEYIAQVLCSIDKETKESIQPAAASYIVQFLQYHAELIKESNFDLSEVWKICGGNP